MGTRSLTVFVEPGGESEGKKYPEREIVVMYRQMDGYPEGHGAELAEFLSGGVMVNGISLTESRRVFNGMGCLAAQVVAHFKDGPGGIYLEPAKSRSDWAEYLYEVSGNTGDEPTIKVYELPYKKRKKLLFAGSAVEVLEWCKNQE